MALSWDPKDPQEVLPSQVDWRPRLAQGDEIVSSQWAITNADDDGALVIASNSFDAAVTTIWLSGGTLEKRYSLANTITTAQGWTMEQTVTIWVRSK